MDILLLHCLVASRGKIFLRKLQNPLLLLFAAAALQAQPYAGVVGGIATLSADARSVLGADAASSSYYKPENGGIVSVFGGVHLNDYLSVQANFTDHRNSLVLNAISTPSAFYEQQRNSARVAGSVDALLYFRGRKSWARPFLSAGIGVARFRSELVSYTAQRGAIAAPPDEFSAVKPVFRSTVGIDIAIRRGWGFRYSFAESIQPNPISPRLTPPGGRNLAVFQNLFGFYKVFGGY